MRFKWVHCNAAEGDINLYEAPNLGGCLGWVERKADDTYDAVVPRELREEHATLRGAMRALRNRIRMNIIGGAAPCE